MHINVLTLLMVLMEQTLHVVLFIPFYYFIVSAESSTQGFVDAFTKYLSGGRIDGWMGGSMYKWINEW